MYILFMFTSYKVNSCSTAITIPIKIIWEGWNIYFFLEGWGVSLNYLSWWWWALEFFFYTCKYTHSFCWNNYKIFIRNLNSYHQNITCLFQISKIMKEYCTVPCDWNWMMIAACTGDTLKLSVLSLSSTSIFTNPTNQRT